MAYVQVSIPRVKLATTPYGPEENYSTQEYGHVFIDTSLDGVSECQTCSALVLEGSVWDHALWHKEQEESNDD
jgi:hypothetical protein